jgi:hypothetical protein
MHTNKMMSALHMYMCTGWMECTQTDCTGAVKKKGGRGDCPPQTNRHSCIGIFSQKPRLGTLGLRPRFWHCCQVFS